MRSESIAGGRIAIGRLCYVPLWESMKKMYCDEQNRGDEMYKERLEEME